MTMGRPSKYSDETPNKVDDYMQVYESQGEVIPTIAGLSLFIGVTRETVYDWMKQEEKAEFSDMVRKLLAKQEVICANQGIAGEFNATITKLIMTKHGYSDKVEQKSSGEVIIKVSEQDTHL